VLSALEGLEIAAPGLKAFVVPIAMLVLVGLFALQPQGTARIGWAFGPVMALWFLTLALLGINGIVQHPSVLAALNPLFAVRYLGTHGLAGFFVLGGVASSGNGGIPNALSQGYAAGHCMVCRTLASPTGAGGSYYSGVHVNATSH